MKYKTMRRKTGFHSVGTIKALPYTFAGLLLFYFIFSVFEQMYYIVTSPQSVYIKGKEVMDSCSLMIVSSLLVT